MAVEPTKIALRVKSKKSQNAVLRDVDLNWKVEDLIVKLSELTGIGKENMSLLKGFPPKRVSYDLASSVESLGLKHQDTLIVETDTGGASGSNGTNSGDNTPLEEVEASETPAVAGSSSNGPAYAGLMPNDDSSGLLLRHVVPSDNSCLFTSVTYCLSAGAPRANDEGSSFLREMIANTVAADPAKYNEAILGRPNKEYVDWIKKPESWGGGIELSILAEFYGIQISVVDTQSLHISCFGEDHNFAQRMFIIYDGIHYDPLYLEPFTGGAIRTVFPTSDTKVMDLAQQLAQEAKACNQFTDLKNFSLRCQICNTLLKGQEEAQAHAKKTKHTSFAEIIKK